MGDLSNEDIEYYKERFGDSAPILEDDVDYFIYRVWSASRESNGFSVGINSKVVFEYAKSEKIDKIFLLEIVKKVEDKLNGFKSKTS